MSSNIRVQRICEQCSAEFTAKTTVTRFCSGKCRKRSYKAKIRNEKIVGSNNETLMIRNKPLNDIKEKEFLTVKEVAILLDCSVRSVYNFIKSGQINAVNIGERMTRIKRSVIDQLFESVKRKVDNKSDKAKVVISESYTLTEIQNKYGISEKALYEIIKRNQIPKIKKGRFVYVSKDIIEKLLG